jgi:hypothetical protein
LCQRFSPLFDSIFSIFREAGDGDRGEDGIEDVTEDGHGRRRKKKMRGEGGGGEEGANEDEDYEE